MSQKSDVDSKYTDVYLTDAELVECRHGADSVPILLKKKGFPIVGAIIFKVSDDYHWEVERDPIGMRTRYRYWKKEKKHEKDDSNK